MDTNVKIQAMKAIRKIEVLVSKIDENGNVIDEMNGTLGLKAAKEIVETVGNIINPDDVVNLNDVKTALKDLMFRSLIYRGGQIDMGDLRALYIQYFSS